MNLTQLTALEAGRLIAAREISAEQLTRACLERIAARDPEVGAFAHFGFEFALAEARRADSEPPRSPLHGVPFGVKDVIDTRDFPTEFGTPIHRGRRPAADAPCVTRMREAGAVLIGKLISTEYAMFTPNGTRHPLNLEHTAGGSSSGSGAAVADFMVPLAFGNQTAGSLIRPAAFCGVYGLKPTHGTTDGAGILQLQPYFDTLGYMARAVGDLQEFHAVVSGQSQREHWSRDTKPRIAICRTHQWDFAEPAARTMLEAAADCFSQLGAEIAPLALPDDYADLVAIHRCVLYGGIARSLATDYRRDGERMSEGLRAVIEEGLAWTPDEFESAFEKARRYRQNVNALFDGFDALICPSAPGEAPLGTATGNPIFQVTWTLLGVPCLNLPVGFGPHGLPLGVQLIGRRHDDARLLAIGERLMRDFAPITIGG